MHSVYGEKEKQSINVSVLSDHRLSQSSVPALVRAKGVTQ